jgi:Rha family phage regulatory protein
MNQLVHQSGDRLIVTSLEISNHFGKRHDDVLKAIRGLDCSPDFAARNYAACTYQDGNQRQRPMYEITRDGFTFLCMGFTGAQAAVWKERYIEAFNQMEVQLRGGVPVHQQQLSLAREMGQLRDMMAQQQKMIVTLFERLDSARRGQIRAQGRITSILERERRMAAVLEKRQARDSILQMEADGVPRDVICVATGRTLNHIRQVVFQAKRDGYFPEVSHD